ncbi:hypothetical protein ISS07_00030 [Candidatus Woesearchaeota archaeon]|nr:hypothetical protein [Candidatus Woesearchaeota archaeon]
MTVGCEQSSIIQTSVPQGDYVKDELALEEACNSIEDYVDCKLLDSKKVDVMDNLNKCVDGASVAGCFSCTFECS